MANTWSSGHCRLEPATELLVLARADGGRIVELRTSSVDCDLDAGGMTLVWLTDVAADESVAWLRTFAGDTQRLADVALSAIALHEGTTASSTLVALAQQDARGQVRSKALFWLAQRASNDAAATIAGAIDNDPDEEVKKKAVFALSQLPRDEGVPKLIEVARSNRTAGVRRQAMFWLGQSNDPRAIEFFSSILLKK
jgi:HEAT repeat protein